jgi:hypothetical protein
MEIKTENHFKICLDREKRKNVELKSLVGKLQTKHKQIHQLIEKYAENAAKGGFETDREKILEQIV